MMSYCGLCVLVMCFFSSRRRHTRCALVTGVQTCALPIFADAGFKASAFLPSYGLAEATLAVSIMPPGEGIVVELVEETELSGAANDTGRPTRYRAIVNCGKAVKDMTIEVRDEAGNPLADQTVGKVWCRSEEHTSELKSLMRISYAVFCLKKKTKIS